MQWKEERRRLLRNSLIAVLNGPIGTHDGNSILRTLLPLETDHFQFVGQEFVCRGSLRSGVTSPAEVVQAFWDLHQVFRNSHTLPSSCEVTEEEVSILKSYVDDRSCLYGCDDHLLRELFKDIKTECGFIKRKDRSGVHGFYTTCWLGKSMISAKVWEHEKRSQTKILCIILSKYGAFWRHCYKSLTNKVVSGAVPVDPTHYIRFLQVKVIGDVRLKKLTYDHCFEGWPHIQNGFDKV